MPFESAEALAENPKRLEELRLQCEADRAKLGEAQCNAVSDAQHMHLISNEYALNTAPRQTLPS